MYCLFHLRIQTEHVKKFSISLGMFAARFNMRSLSHKSEVLLSKQAEIFKNLNINWLDWQI